MSEQITLTSIQQEIHRFLAVTEERGCTFCLIAVFPGESKKIRFGITTALMHYQTSKSTKVWLASSRAEKVRLQQQGQPNVHVANDVLRGFNGMDSMAIFDHLYVEDNQPHAMVLQLMSGLCHYNDAFFVIVAYMEHKPGYATNLYGFQEYATLSDEGFAIVQTVTPSPSQI